MNWTMICGGATLLAKIARIRMILMGRKESLFFFLMNIYIHLDFWRSGKYSGGSNTDALIVSACKVINISQNPFCLEFLISLIACFLQGNCFYENVLLGWNWAETFNDTICVRLIKIVIILNHASVIVIEKYLAS